MNIERRVLVVDDEPDMRTLLVAYLRMAGWQVKAAGSGKEALGMAAEEQFDAVLVDWQMPVMDGPDLLRQMRLCEATRDLPAILFTAKKCSQDTSELVAMGFAGVLPKSFSTELLVKDISEILGWTE